MLKMMLAKLVEVFEMDQPFRIRVEIFKRQNEAVYYARVYKFEFYRIQPTFPQTEGAPPSFQADEVVQVEIDYLFQEDDLKGDSSEVLLDKIIKALGRI